MCLIKKKKQFISVIEMLPMVMNHCTLYIVDDEINLIVINFQNRKSLWMIILFQCFDAFLISKQLIFQLKKPKWIYTIIHFVHSIEFHTGNSDSPKMIDLIRMSVENHLENIDLIGDIWLSITCVILSAINRKKFLQSSRASAQVYFYNKQILFTSQLFYIGA